MVFVHPGHLVRPQAVRLPHQSSAHQGRAPGRQGQPDGRRAQDEGELTVGDPAHVLRRDAGRDQAHHLPVGGLDGHDGLDQRADGALDLLGHRLPGQRRGDVPHEGLADAVRPRVGVADALRVGDDHEVHVRGLAHRLGPGLEHRRGVGAAQRLDDAGGVGERRGHGDRPVAGLRVAVVAYLEHQCDRRGDHEQQHDDHVHHEDLAGHAASGQRRAQRRGGPRVRPPP